MNQDLYYYYDSGMLVSRSPYMSLISESQARDYIDRLYYLVTEYFYLLEGYPFQRYEQIRDLYYVHQNVSTLNENLVCDFFNHTFRGACWASLLIAISPNEKYRVFLEDFLKKCHPKNRWITIFAIYSITGEYHEYEDKLREIKSKFKLFKQTPVKLRLMPTKDELRRHNDEIERIRVSYKVNGLESTMKSLKSKEIYNYMMPHDQWVLASTKNA